MLELRRRLKVEYGELFDSVAALLFRHDPIGMICEGDTNTDEYQPEARTILPRLKSCHSADDAHVVVHDEFVRWFDGGYGWLTRAIYKNRCRDLGTVAATSGQNE